MPNAIEDIKSKVQRYQELLASKEKLNEEFASWTELFSDMSLTVRKVKLAYEMQPTEENKAELDMVLKDEREYLEILNEYALKFKEINEELDRYDEDSLDEQREFLDNTHKLQVLEKQIREKKKAMNAIKRELQRVAGGEKIGTNLIQVPNYRGKNVWINANYEPEFTKLVEETRELVKARNELSNIMAKQYNRQINLIEEPIVEEAVMDVLPPEKPTVIYDENYYDNAPIDERIADIKEHMENLKKVRGPKKLVTYKGEKIRMSEYAEKKFKFYAGELAKLEREKEEQEKLQEQTVIPDQQTYLDILFEKKTGELPNAEKHKKLDVLMLDDPLDDLELELDDSEDINPSEKPKGFMKLLNIKKPKFVDKIKNVIKKHAVSLTCGLMILTMSTIVFTMAFKDNMKNSQNNSDDDLDNQITYSQTTDKEENIPNYDIIDSPINEEVNSTTTLLGTSFNVTEGANLYKNMYDATLNRDGLDGYFAENSERVVSGVVIQFEGQLFFFSQNDINAEANIQVMIAKGGKITSVLSQVQGDTAYEGFYNVNDVITLNNVVGGITR